MANKGLLRRLGPGLITASVVLGPGSIIASSRAGAEQGYRLLWVLVAAGVFMAVYTSMGARLGCVLDVTPLTYVTRRSGRWLAVLTGLSAFLVTAGFQFGNNMGVAFAVSGATGTPEWIWPIAFTAVSLLFLFTAKSLYTVLERIMKILVAVMIVCFFANVCLTGVTGRDLLGGFIPRLGKGSTLIARSMLATTFSVVAAFYQAYLVQAKQWRREEMGDAVRDAWVGIAILGLISAAILAGAAEVLHGTAQSFKHVGELAQALGGVLGPGANVVFCFGLGAAAFSSFIVNALVGGAMLADGLGFDARVEAWPARLLAAAVMVIGCVVAVVTFRLGAGATTTTSLLIAQASTLIAAPLCAGLLFVLSSSRATMGDLRNNAVAMAIGIVGFCVILALWGVTLKGLIEKLI
ncbi:MAG: hypothetical protein GWP08_18240 [Nitrospiraceae bacterium]|nr:hypothetical protein [Nitrospiraceae bacterium]